MKFDEIDWYAERIIVLFCGHVYTMASMDYYMEMQEYYEESTKGGWTSIKTLSTKPSSNKTCPACRTPIRRIKRYGRIIKKYTLDVQTRKFFQKYDQIMKNLVKEIRLYDIFARNNLKNQLKTVYSIDKRPKDVIFKEFKIENETLPEIVPYQYFNDVEKYHGFESSNAEVWISHVKKLLKVYQDLSLIVFTTKTPPHKNAFEAAILSL